jgi:amidase
MTVKESFDVIGLPTTWGLTELKENIPTANALAVDRLLAAGAVIFGKTNAPVLLADSQSYNPVYGTTNNPWDTSRTPGGSSGGAAAALAAGLTGLELGSDIGGSIRNPAHYCGVFGHKPTYGIAPPRGQALYGNVATSDISVIGPLARSAEDLTLALDIVAGPDPVEAAVWRLDLAAPRGKALTDYRIAVMLDDPIARSITRCRTSSSAWSIFSPVKGYGLAIGRARTSTPRNFTPSTSNCCVRRLRAG